MTPSQQAYQDWKLSHKLQLRAHTEEELFCIGYELRDAEIEHLENIIEALNDIIEEPVAPVVEPKPKKAKKNETE